MQCVEMSVANTTFLVWLSDRLCARVLLLWFDLASLQESAQKRAETSSAAGAPDVGTEATKVTPALREEDLRAVMSES